jgi:carboxyl-terminal processing protease
VTLRIHRLALPLAAALALAAAPAHAQTHRAHASGTRTPPAHAAAARGTPITPALAQATFDTAWSAIYTTLWDTAVANHVWTQARSDLRPRALQAKTVEELRGVIQEAIHRLGYSHFEVIPGDVQERLSASSARGTGEPGLEVRLVGAQVLVTRVDSGGPAFAAGVRPGWIVTAVNGRPVAQTLALLERIPEARQGRGRQLYAWSAVSGQLRGDPGSKLGVAFVDGAGRAVRKELTLRASTATMEKLGNLPPLPVTFEQRRLALPGGGSAGLIRFNYWLPVAIARLNAAVDSLRDADGMIIDLRGNLGGLGAMAPGFAGHFLDAPDTLGIMRTRTQNMYFVVNPRRVDTQARPVHPYAGPVAILSDAMTGSTSEFFAGGLQQLGRVRVFGEPSAAQALPSLPQKLPDGDVLLHAMADFVGPRGQRFEGLGVTPEVPAPPTRAALLAGHDPALDAALAWIAGQRAHH